MTRGGRRAGFRACEDTMVETSQETAATLSRVDGDAALRKIAARLVPFLIICYFAAYLDRVNLGFAAASMNASLGFSPTVFGWGAGVFFLGYALCETPSNLILHRTGARRWIARIMISWGLASGLMAFVWNETSFYALRFILGATEAGFFPGVILYITYWFPRLKRAQIFSWFLIAIPLSTVVGAPLSGMTLTLTDGLLGLHGWQWLFILETLPSILLGVASWFYLTDCPAQAHWLSAEERDWLQDVLEKEQRDAPESETHVFWPALKDPRNLLLGFSYFGVVLALYGVNLWLPQIVAGFGFEPVAAGFVTALPYLIGTAAMIFWGWRSDRTAERYGHTMSAALLTALGLVGAGLATNAIVSIIAVTVAVCGTLATIPAFWALTTQRISGARAAASIAIINSIGHIAGFIGPYAVGWLKDNTGGFSSALFALSLGPILCAALTAATALRDRG